MSAKALEGWRQFKVSMSQYPSDMRTMMVSNMVELVLATADPKNTDQVSLQAARVAAGMAVVRSRLAGRQLTPTALLTSRDQALVSDAEALAEVLAEDSARLYAAARKEKEELEGKLLKSEDDYLKADTKAGELAKQNAILEDRLKSAEERIAAQARELEARGLALTVKEQAQAQAQAAMEDLRTKLEVASNRPPVEQHTDVIAAIKATIAAELKGSVEVARRSVVEVFAEGFKDYTDFKVSLAKDTADLLKSVEQHPEIQKVLQQHPDLAVAFRMIQRGLLDYV